MTQHLVREDRLYSFFIFPTRHSILFRISCRLHFYAHKFLWFTEQVIEMFFILYSTSKIVRARHLTRGPARPFRGSFWGSFWGSFLGSFLTHFLTTFLTSKTVSFLPLKIESKNEHFLKTFFSGPRAGPPKKPSLSNKRIGTRNTDSHMIPIIFVHSKKRLVHPRDTPKKPGQK